MKYNEAVKIVNSFTNNHRKLNPKDLISDDWRNKTNGQYIIVYSNELNIELFYTKNKFDKLKKKVCKFKTMTSNGFVSMNDYYLALDTIESIENQEIKFKDLDNLSIVEDFDGERYLIFKKGIVHREIAMTALSSSYTDKELNIFEDNIAAVKIHENEFNFGIKHNEPFFPALHLKDIFMRNQVRKLKFKNVLDIDKSLIIKSLKQFFSYKFVLEGATSINIDGMENVKIKTIGSDPRRFMNKVNYRGILEEFISSYDYGSLVFVSNKPFLENSVFEKNDLKDGSFYIRQRNEFDGSFYLEKVKDIDALKNRLFSSLNYIDDLFDEDDLITEVSSIEDKIILPVAFI